MKATLTKEKKEEPTVKKILTLDDIQEFEPPDPLLLGGDDSDDDCDTSDDTD